MRCICNILILFVLIYSSTISSETISFDGGSLQITSPILITNSNTTIRGNNTSLLLKSNSNCPIIIIGNPYGRPLTNIEVCNLTLHGNRREQSTELWKILPCGIINNNGIIVQNARDIFVHDINIEGCRSGGLITTFHVSHLIVSNMSSFNNEFDGIACYETKDSIFVNLILYDNRAAGISLDDHFNSNRFRDIYIKNNEVGIFMRNSCSNMFSNINIENCHLKMFISHVDKDMKTGCTDNIFEKVVGNGKFIINEETCNNNVFKF